MGERLASVNTNGTPASPTTHIFKSDIAPYDPLTLVTYALAPRDDMPSKNDGSSSHHHTNHSESFFLGQGLVGRAARTSRLQLAFNQDHNNGPAGYHSYFRRSYFPRGIREQTGLVLMYAAKVIPGEVIDMPRREVRPITNEERQRLFSSDEISMQSEFATRRLLTAFVLSHVDRHAKKGRINAYAGARTDGDKQEIANHVIGQLIPTAFKFLDQRYELARQNGSLSEVAPANPSELARQFIFQAPERFGMFEDVVFNGSSNLWLPVSESGQVLQNVA